MVMVITSKEGTNIDKLTEDIECPDFHVIDEYAADYESICNKLKQP